MSIKESALSAITSIAQSDFIRTVTSLGASRNVTVANLAKAIVESYTGSTLAGSNQSVKAALDSLNSKIGTVTTLTANDDLNSLVSTGMYYHKTERPSNIPVAAGYGVLVVLGAQVGNQVTSLQLYSSTGGRLYYRRKAGDISDVWAGWKYITATDA